MVARMVTRLIVSIVSFWFLGQGPAHAENLHMSYAGTSGYNVPFWVTQEAGLFIKYGLPSELLLISGGSTSVQALLANELQFVNAGATPAIQAILQGAPVVMIASYYNLMPYSFVVGKSVRSVSDLKGKRMAITRLGGIAAICRPTSVREIGAGFQGHDTGSIGLRRTEDCSSSVRRRGSHDSRPSRSFRSDIARS